MNINAIHFKGFYYPPHTHADYKDFFTDSTYYIYTFLK